jgi:peptidoglycan/xylan/chitin deacetylase (PgdA/CDA1 family)
MTASEHLGPTSQVGSCNRVIAILAYHKIGEPPPYGWRTWYYVPDETLVEHVNLVRAAGWRTIDLDMLLDGLDAPERLPMRSALFTFDDGYHSFMDTALPRLEEYQCPSVMFVPTAYIGARNGWDEGSEPDEPICDWEDLRELVRRGVSIQSHAESHRQFSSLDPRAVDREITASKSALEDGLGVPISTLAFPYGDGGSTGQRVGHALRRAGYRAACLYKGGPLLVPTPDRFRLTRIAVGPDTDLRRELGRLGHDPGATTR